MVDLTFREKIEKPEPAPEVKLGKADEPLIPETKSEVDTPPVMYRELRGKPYSAEYFELGETWKKPDLNYKNDLEAIDDYYRSKVQIGDCQDSKKSFEKLIKEAEKVTRTEGASANVRIAKIANFFRMMGLNDLIDERRHHGGPESE